MFKRIFLIVLDSVGVGEARDAKDYGDVGANTIYSAARSVNRLEIRNMEKMGIGNLTDIPGVRKITSENSYYCKQQEISRGKDTLTGHYEIMGLEVLKPFKTFTETGFPKELIDELEKETGRKVIGNKAASGTEIIKELGEEQLKTGALIVYTSSDSVLQIAMHEGIIPLEEQYHICEIARKLTLKDEYKVGRVIARPFIGTNYKNFERTANRHDYALDPFGKTTLDYLKENNYEVIAIGKINDIYNGKGITSYMRNKSNDDGMDHIIEVSKKDFTGLCFLNLVDFDSLYGHRRNPIGYANALEEFDDRLEELLPNLKDDDLLMITADHGNDPMFKGTDHTREYTPLLIYNKNFKEGKNLGILESFANIGATIADNFNVTLPKIGKSLLKDLK